MEKTRPNNNSRTRAGEGHYYSYPGCGFYCKGGYQAIQPQANQATAGVPVAATPGGKSSRQMRFCNVWQPLLPTPFSPACVYDTCSAT